jgi:hypothetical protein
MCCFATRAQTRQHSPRRKSKSGKIDGTRSRKPAPSGTETTAREAAHMAIFHLTAKILSRGKGQSAIAAAAYRSGERLRDEQANEQKYYQTRAERIEFTAILAPKDAPAWAQDRNELWNHAERAEKRKDAQLAREIEVSLPHELTAQQREWLVKDFAREAFVRKGYAVDIAIHAPDKESDQRNHHAHLMVTRRTLGPDGFAATKDWKRNPQELAEWREQWANLVNRHLERHGHDARIDHRSLKEQGIDREAGVHLGYAANEMAQRGAQSDRMDALKDVIARNDIRLEMKQLDGELERLEAERKRAAPENALDWTDRAGMTAQQDSALRAFQARGGGLFPPVAPSGAGANPTPATSKPEPATTTRQPEPEKAAPAPRVMPPLFTPPAKPPEPQKTQQPSDAPESAKPTMTPTGQRPRETGLMADFVTPETKKKAAEEAAARANDPNQSHEPGGRGRTR